MILQRAEKSFIYVLDGKYSSFDERDVKKSRARPFLFATQIFSFNICSVLSEWFKREKNINDIKSQTPSITYWQRHVTSRVEWHAHKSISKQPNVYIVIKLDVLKNYVSHQVKVNSSHAHKIE